MLSKANILGVGITNETEKKVLEYVLERVKKRKKSVIVTPNPEILVYAAKHPRFKMILNQADLALPDGVGLTIAARLLKKPLKKRITGVDFIETLCKASREKPLFMGFLGGRDGVAARAVERLKQKYPWIEARWVGEEWDEAEVGGWRLAVGLKESSYDVVRHGTAKGKLRAKSQEQRAHIDILFVAFGFPKQEEWIAKNLPHIPVTVAMGVGGAFDYLSEDIARAPKFIRSIGFEWLFRLIHQPWRWKRQQALLTFVKLVIQEYFQKIVKADNK